MSIFFYVGRHITWYMCLIIFYSHHSIAEASSEGLRLLLCNEILSNQILVSVSDVARKRRERGWQLCIWFFKKFAFILFFSSDMKNLISINPSPPTPFIHPFTIFQEGENRKLILCYKNMRKIERMKE